MNLGSAFLFIPFSGLLQSNSLVLSCSYKCSFTFLLPALLANVQKREEIESSFIRFVLIIHDFLLLSFFFLWLELLLCIFTLLPHLFSPCFFFFFSVAVAAWVWKGYCNSCRCHSRFSSQSRCSLWCRCIHTLGEGSEPGLRRMPHSCASYHVFRHFLRWKHYTILYILKVGYWILRKYKKLGKQVYFLRMSRESYTKFL